MVEPPRRSFDADPDGVAEREPKAADAPPTRLPRPARAERRRITAEIWIVLGLSLGQAAVYALINIVARLTAGKPLAQQTATLNASQSARPYLDLTYQVVGIIFVLVPVALAFYLLATRGTVTPAATPSSGDATGATSGVAATQGPSARTALAALGIDGSRPWRDVGWGFALAAGIGIPGLAFYALSRALGITVQVQASALNAYWWTVPVLILAAFQNGLLEEFIAVGYLRERLTELGWDRIRFIAASAVLRGSYHLYQGIGPFFGNVAMGVVFAWFYTSRWGRRRVIPLVIAHTLLDVVAFVGYALIPKSILEGLGVT